MSSPARRPPSTAPLPVVSSSATTRTTTTPYSDVSSASSSSLSSSAAAGAAVTETTAVPDLKVMRLQKPSLHTPTAGTVSPSSTCILQTSMCLPDSFGTICVGETFDAYLGALNPSPSKTVLGLKVVAQLQTPSRRHRLALKNKSKSKKGFSGPGTDYDDGGDDDGRSIDVDAVPPLRCVDSIVSHGPLTEQGQHILRVEVSYLQVMGTAASDGSGGGGGGGGGDNFLAQKQSTATATSTTTKLIRKFYRFQVTNPLSLSHEIWRRSDRDLFVSVEIRNDPEPGEGMTVSSATFEPPPVSSSTAAVSSGPANDGDGSGDDDGPDDCDSGGTLQVQRVTTTSSNSSSIADKNIDDPTMTTTTNRDQQQQQDEEKSSVSASSALQLFDACGRLDPGSSRRYLFHLSRRQPSPSPTTTTTDRGIASGDELGRPVFRWRKACGETGTMKGPTLFCPDLPLFLDGSSMTTSPRSVVIMDGGGRGGSGGGGGGGGGFVVYTHGGGSHNNVDSGSGCRGDGGGGGSAVSIDVATKAAARSAGGGPQSSRGRHMNPGAAQQQGLPLDEWLPVTVEPINPPSSIVVGVPTQISFLVVNHTEHPLSLQLQFSLEYMHGLAVCGPSFVNLRDNVGGYGGTTTVEIRVVGFQPGLAKLSGCSVLDLATGEQIPQLPQFHALVVPS